MDSIYNSCKLPSILGFETQYQTYFDNLQDGNKMKLRRVILPDGTKILEKVPDSPEEIEKKRKLKEERKKLNKKYRKELQEISPEEKKINRHKSHNKWFMERWSYSLE